jgi:hypothetical protein
MSLYFLVNNLHFAFGMTGVIVLVIATWLTLDSYNVQKSAPVFLRFLGFTLFAVWQAIHALNVKSDVFLYVGYTLLILGLLFIIVSFLQTKQLAMSAVLVIPAFTIYAQKLSIISTILFFLIAFLAFRQWKREFNKTWIPLAITFLLFGFTYLINIFDNGANPTSLLYIAGNLIELIGVISLGFWVWQYMKLRISESTIMLLVGVTFILSIVVTLAFSTILINGVIADNANSLLTDVKVLNFSISSMENQALAQAQLISLNPDIITAVNKNDFTSLSQLSGSLLEQYNLGFLTITDKNGDVLARGHALSKRGDSLSGERVLEEALLKNSTVTIEDSSVQSVEMQI